MILGRGITCHLSDFDMPKRLFIISDMGFNQCDRNFETNYEAIKRKYLAHNYTLPQIVFWNVNGSTTDFPVSVQDNGTALVAGYSPAVMKAIMSSRDFSPYTIMRTVLDGERYEKIAQILAVQASVVSETVSI